MTDMRTETMRARQSDTGRACDETPSRGGWIIVESSISLAVLGMVFVMLALSQEGGRRFNAVMLARQRCVAAGQSELDSIAATGQPIAPQKLPDLWPGVRAEIEQLPGQGQWAGMKLIRVTTRATAYGRDVKIVLARYLPGEERR